MLMLLAALSLGQLAAENMERIQNNGQVAVVSFVENDHGPQGNFLTTEEFWGTDDYPEYTGSITVSCKDIYHVWGRWGWYANTPPGSMTKVVLHEMRNRCAK